MIRMIQSKASAHAKAYFRDALLKADYYLEGQEMNGWFHGKLAERLGIAGPATQEWFYALCDNRHPVFGEPLTPRTKKDRTTGYDINFHAPKSVSIVHALSDDGHILEAFRHSVTETMKEIEADSMTRVRKGRNDFDRKTGELVWADFIHQTARPVDGHSPDPHLHAHCYTFNLTWDGTEHRVKAAQFRQINKEMPYYQAAFQKRFSDKLIALGYRVRRTAKSFEIEGVPEPIIKMFSKRTDEIGRVAKQKGITDAKELSELGAKTRAAKQSGLSMEALRADWRAQIKAAEPEQKTTEETLKTPEPLRVVPDNDKLVVAYSEAAVQQCIDHALLHHFERASVTPERKLEATALHYSIGHQAAPINAIRDAIQADKRILRIEEKGATVCTTKEVLGEEQRMVRLAQQGIGSMAPLYNQAPALNLKGQQAEAVTEVLTNSNRVSIIRGAAGAGKTTLMTEAVSLMEQAGKKVTVVAPTAKASRGVLREEGFEKADTVAMLLQDKERQKELRDGILWVDEAGLLGTKDMAELLRVATEQNARLILGGDTRQHASVIRGDALRILNTIGGIKTAEVNKIYRQKDKAYRSAVADIAQGDIRKGFIKLDELGAIRQAENGLSDSPLVKDYVQALKNGKTAIVISPTHQQGDQVTDAIRLALRREKRIGKKEIQVTKLTNKNLTEAERNDWRSFASGQVLRFNQNLPGIQRGSLWNVQEVNDKHILISDAAGNIATLPEQKGKYFEVYRPSQIGLSKGDKLRITRNGFDRNQNRLNNGQELEVVKVMTKGDILLQNPVSKVQYRLGQDYGHLTHAYCSTSHAAQGRTVDEAFVWQPASTFLATDAKQFYVSVSRAREKLTIYTDDKAELLEHAAQIGDRRSAIELLDGKERHTAHLQQVERTKELERSAEQEIDKQRDDYDDRDYSDINFDDYEPGF